MTRRERVSMIIMSVGILIFFCGLMCFGISLATKGSSTTRMITAEVVSVENNDTLLEDTTGNVWSIKDNSYSRGDRVIITFDTKGSNSVLDDEIIKINVNE